MKVNISKYPNWVGPHQILNWFTPIFGDKRIAKIEESKAFDKVADITLPCFQWIHDTFQKRKIKVRIDKFDTWGMDHTLSLIILPMLKQLKDTKHGSPNVDDGDVPEHLRSTNAPPAQNGTDELWHKRWEWILNEMIWAFTQIHDDDWEAQYHGDHSKRIAEALGEADDNELYKIAANSIDENAIDFEGIKEHNKRIDVGTKLFGKYYRGLWD